MRYEPANAKFFDIEVRWKSLASAVKLLGCFDTNKTIFEPHTNSDFVKRGFDVFEQFFFLLDDEITSPFFSEENMLKIQNTFRLDEKLIYVCCIMRYLYDTAVDSFDR
jgi:hypothetical protein